MSTHALVRVRKLRERGKKIVEFSLPDRILRLLKQTDPASVRFRFGINESFEVGASELKEAVVETHKRKRRRGELKC